VASGVTDGVVGGAEGVIEGLSEATGGAEAPAMSDGVGAPDPAGVGVLEQATTRRSIASVETIGLMRCVRAGIETRNLEVGGLDDGVDRVDLDDDGNVRHRDVVAPREPHAPVILPTRRRQDRIVVGRPRSRPWTLDDAVGRRSSY
jgi:hypothetical protein